MRIQQIPLEKGGCLTAYLHEPEKQFANASPRQAVLICPGGAYQRLSKREGEPVALAYLAEGFSAFVLQYSVGKGVQWPLPLEQAREALALIRQNAREWDIDPQRIAAVGFSAGGHLAAALCLEGKERPQAMVLGYPCLGQPQCGLMQPMNPPALLGKGDKNTPPAFLFSTWEDEIVPVQQTLDFAGELARLEVPVECHVFQHGIHGLSLSKPFTSSGRSAKVDEDVRLWHPMSVRWLRRLWGDYPADALDPCPTAQSMGGYSVDVLGRSLMEDPRCMAILQRYYPLLQKPEYAWGARPLTIRALNSMLPSAIALPEDRLDALDKELRQVIFFENGKKE